MFSRAITTYSTIFIQVSTLHLAISANKRQVKRKNVVASKKRVLLSTEQNEIRTIRVSFALINDCEGTYRTFRGIQYFNFRRDVIERYVVSVQEICKGNFCVSN